MEHVGGGDGQLVTSSVIHSVTSIVVVGGLREWIGDCSAGDVGDADDREYVVIDEVIMIVDAGIVDSETVVYWFPVEEKVVVIVIVEHGMTLVVVMTLLKIDVETAPSTE